MFKPALTFAREIFRFNLIISIAIGFLGFLVGNSLAGYLTGFLSVLAFSLFTGGFLFAVYFYILKYNKRFYFYYNLGYNKLKLISFAWLFNLPVVLAIYFLIAIINAI